MSKILLNFSPEKIENLDEMCDLLGLTRSECLSHLYIWGKWVFEQAREGRPVVSIDDETKICQAILSSSKLDQLTVASQTIKSLAK